MTILKTIARKRAPRAERCAAQHMGPWMVEPKWFTQAVAAVKAGTFRPVARPAASGEVKADNGHVFEVAGDAIYTLYWIEGGIARVPFSGQVTKADSSFGGVNSTRTRRAIRKAVHDDRVDSILLHVDSPGGTVAGTGDLAADVAAADAIKPVYAYIEDLGASAAYWVASRARKVFANPTALVGSIGTVAVVEDTSGKAEKEGVRVVVVSTGPFKGAFADGAPVTEEQVADLRREVEQLNEHFLSGVMSGRGMTREALLKVADGRVFIAEEALQLGLIDAVSSFDAVVSAISQEVFNMTLEEFNKAKAEHPEWIAAEADAARAAAVKDTTAALTPKPAKLAELRAAFKDADFVCDQADKGATMADAAVAFMAVQAEKHAKAEAEAKARIDALTAEKAALEKKVAALSDGPAPISVGKPDTGKPDPEAIEDPKARAEAEWESDAGGCKTTFASKDIYVRARVRTLARG